MTDTIYPLAFDWDGEAMIPKNPTRADRQYVVGMSYTLVPHEPRSAASHNHYFSALHDGWMNLAEVEAERFPTVDHLRAYALIKTGYCNSESIVLPTKADALRVAAFTRAREEFAIVTVTECTVTVYTAKSQSMKAMGKVEFQKSKTDVLDLVASMAGVKTEALHREAGAAA